MKVENYPGAAANSQLSTFNFQLKNFRPGVINCTLCTYIVQKEQREKKRPMNPKEYNTIVDKYSDDLYRFALRYTGDKDDSNDAVQDCFVKLWEHHEQVHADKVKGYLMRVLYRLLVDRYRRRKRLVGERLIPEEACSPHSDYELHDSIEKMLATLTGEQRMLLLLRDLEGYSYKEMAEMTGLSEQQVMTYLYRARVKARKYLTENR